MKQWVNRLLMYTYFNFIWVENQYKQQLSWNSKKHTKKFLYGETPVRRTYLTGKFPYGEISVRRNFLRQNFLTAKFPYGEISSWQDILTAKFLTAKYPTAKNPTAKFPVSILRLCVLEFATFAGAPPRPGHLRMLSPRHPCNSASFFFCLFFLLFFRRHKYYPIFQL